jgi:hypothetical protein
MNAKHPISQALWDHTPTTIQDFIDAPEARGVLLDGTVQRLEAMVQRVILQVQQNSHNSSRLRQMLWTFVRYEGMEPMIHTAKRAIRPGA